MAEERTEGYWRTLRIAKEEGPWRIENCRIVNNHDQSPLGAAEFASRYVPGDPESSRLGDLTIGESINLKMGAEYPTLELFETYGWGHLQARLEMIFFLEVEREAAAGTVTVPLRLVENRLAQALGLLQD